MSGYKTPTTEQFPLPPFVSPSPVSNYRPPVHVKADAEPLDFYRAVYTDPNQPLWRRMEAAIEALPYAHVELKGKLIAGLPMSEIRKLMNTRRIKA
jgi:hypothetical protein